METSVFVVRAFVKMREMLAGNQKLALKLEELENRIGEHDDNFQIVFQALKELLHEEENPKRKIGF